MDASGGRDGTVLAVAVADDALVLLPGTGFADSYRVQVGGGLTPARAMDALFAHSPPWFRPLMKVRDRVMAPFGVKPAGTGPFPVVSSDERRVVTGYDDSHLDFRLVGDLAPGKDGFSLLTLTTLVRFNNLVGRAYLAAILPFHRLIVRTSLRNLARAPHEQF